MKMKSAVLCLSSLALAHGKIYFSETFDKNWDERWTMSHAKLDTAGKMELHTGKYYGHEEDDKGLYSVEDEKHYMLSANFEPFTNEGKDLIIQYEAKYEQEVMCGGGYIKVGPPIEDATEFGDETPYNVMFGPDICAFQSQTHVILSHNGQNYHKETIVPYKQQWHELHGIPRLYRLTLRPNNTIRVEIDNTTFYDGEIENDWQILKPRLIIDEEVKKPSWWVDKKTMDDPSEKMPEGWVQERRIKDPTATKPEDWNDEDDGEWEAPTMDNPEYKGKWRAKQIPNPAYVGHWKVHRIPNPEYVPADLYKYTWGYVGIDVWQVQAQVIWDNIIITDDVAEADEFKKKWIKHLIGIERMKDDEHMAEHRARYESDEDYRRDHDEFQAAFDRILDDGGGESIKKLHKGIKESLR